MKARTIAMTPFVALVFAMAVACNDTETEYVSAPSISLAQAVVAVPEEGGGVSVSYAISNPVDAGEVSAAASSSWLADIDCSATTGGGIFDLHGFGQHQF